MSKYKIDNADGILINGVLEIDLDRITYKNTAGSALLDIETNTNSIKIGVPGTVQYATHTINIGLKKSNDAVVFSNAPVDGTNNAISDNMWLYFGMRNSAGNKILSNGIFLTHINVTPDSEQSLIVIRSTIQSSNIGINGASGRTVISTRNRHTYGTGAGVLHVENRDNSSSITTMLVDAFEQNTIILTNK